MTTPTTELATITEYGPPYWDDRAWNPDRIEQRERRLFRALHTGDPYKVLRQLSALERRYEDLGGEHNRSRAFAVDLVLSVDTWEKWQTFCEALAAEQARARKALAELTTT